MGSIDHFEDDKKDFVKNIHRLERLGVWFVDSTSWGVSVHHS